MNISALPVLESEEYFTVRWGHDNWRSIDPELSLVEKKGNWEKTGRQNNILKMAKMQK